MKRDWRNLQQTLGRLVPSELGSYTNCTGGGSFRRGEAAGGAEEAVGVKGRKEKKKKKHPRVTSKHSAFELCWISPRGPAATKGAGSRTEGCQSIRQ